MKTLTLLATLALAACQAPGTTNASLPAGHVLPDEYQEGPSSPEAKAAVAAARNAQRVVPDEPGTVRAVEEPVRPLEGAPTGRVWLLELYQQALSAKEALARQVADLTRERDAATAQVQALEQARGAAEARSAALDAEAQELRAKSLELARRLAESEIARLEAEKSALERDAARTGKSKERP
jgi:hypothetical protein